MYHDQRWEKRPPGTSRLLKRRHYGSEGWPVLDHLDRWVHQSRKTECFHLLFESIVVGGAFVSTASFCFALPLVSVLCFHFSAFLCTRLSYVLTGQSTLAGEVKHERSTSLQTTGL